VTPVTHDWWFGVFVDSTPIKRTDAIACCLADSFTCVGIVGVGIMAVGITGVGKAGASLSTAAGEQEPYT